MVVIKIIQENPQISIAAIETKTGLSKRTVARTIASIKEKAILPHIGANNNVTWVIKKSES